MWLAAVLGCSSRHKEIRWHSNNYSNRNNKTLSLLPLLVIRSPVVDRCRIRWYWEVVTEMADGHSMVLGSTRLCWSENSKRLYQKGFFYTSGSRFLFGGKDLFRPYIIFFGGIIGKPHALRFTVASR